MLGPLPGAKGTVITEIWSLLSKTFSLMGKKPEKWCAQWNDGSMQKVPWEYRRIVSGPKGKPGADERIIYK